MMRRVMTAVLAAAVLCWCLYVAKLAWDGFWLMLRTLGVL